MQSNFRTAVSDSLDKGYQDYVSEVREKDPTGRALGEDGAKLDQGKAPVLTGCLQYFPRALEAIAAVSQAGMEKGYAWKSWETVPNGIQRYGNAMARHLLEEASSGAYDSAPNGIKTLHAAQVAWNALARLELMLKSGLKAKL